MSSNPAFLVAATPDLDALPAAAVLAVALAARGREPALLLDLQAERYWRSGLLAAERARRRAAMLAGAGEGLRVVTRGHLVVAAPRIGNGSEGWRGRPVAERRAELASLRESGPIVVHLPAEELWPTLLELEPPLAVLVQARRGADRPLCALIAISLRERAVPVKIWTRQPRGIAARRALAGLEPGGTISIRGARTADALLEQAGARPTRSEGAQSPLGERGQALPMLAGLLVLAAVFALALAAIGGATSAKGRAQRAVDLAALSAARAMRDDFSRLFIAARRADGSPDPRHLPKQQYLRRAEDAARQAAARNGLDPGAVTVSFPGRGSFAPLRVAVLARPRVSIDGTGAGEARLRLEATAAAEPGPGAGEEAPVERGDGDYSGPLVSRQGKPMRPDVAAAFDRLAAAAARGGHTLIVNSAYRSDAEQARLFAANPDPRWVAPPGSSLHRCGTELDLGPPAAHGWLGANARRFGFVRRYAWEPWHFGFEEGPPPCSAAANRLATGAARPAADGRSSAGRGLPGFVPPRFRRPLLAAAARHGVSAALLAAQLMAESNFNPAAVSPAGAQGIAQFMPQTAAAYGLADPFDPERAIDAQARLMADLIARFESPRLALAAYNAGPAPVAACGCVPPYPETQAYVARILGLLGGAGALAAREPLLEVRLIA